MATEKTTTERFEGYRSPNEAHEIELNRITSMLDAIESLGALIEERSGLPEIYPFTAAIQGCVRAGRQSIAIVERAHDSASAGVQHV